jgi:hypothetical protein
MPYYMVSYDLRREWSAADYDKLYERLQSFPDWCWPLESVWIVQSTSSSAVYNKIVSCFDVDDGLVVAELTGSLCFDKPQKDTDDWLSERFSCR